MNTKIARRGGIAGPLLAVALIASGCAADTPDAAPEASEVAVDLGSVTIALPSPSAYFMLPIVAREQGFFEDHGVSATVEYVQPGASSPALAGGQIQFAMIAGHVAHTLSLAGANVVDVATFIERPMASLVVSQDINDVADLAGKTIASSVPTAVTTLLLDEILREEGLDRATDMEARVIAATPDQLSAFNSGAVSAFMATKPLDSVAVAEGGKILVDLAESGAKWPFASLLANGAYAAENGDAVVAVIRALLDARQWWVDNPEEAKALIASETGIESAEIITASYETASEVLLEEPIPSLELSELVLKSLENVEEFAAAAADADASRFIDPSFAEEAIR